MGHRFCSLKNRASIFRPFTFLALRYVCVLAILIPLVLWLRPRFPSSTRGWAAVIGVGWFLQTGYFLFTYLSLRYGLTGGAIALITCQQPILIGPISGVDSGGKSNDHPLARAYSRCIRCHHRDYLPFKYSRFWHAWVSIWRVGVAIH